MFISMGKIDQDTAADLQFFLKDKNHKWLKLLLLVVHIEHLQIPICYIASE